MNRLTLMVVKNIFRVPFLYTKLCRYAKTPDSFSQEEMFAHIKKIVECANWGGNVTVEGYGLENLPKQSGYLIYANHQGMFDTLAIIHHLNFPTGAVYKKELTNIPLLREVAACTHSFAMDRDNVRQSLTVIQNVTKEVAENHRNYMIFPEGTRSRKGNEMGEFHHGSFKCALRAKCPVVPVALIDSYKVLDAAGTAPLTVQVRFLPPILPEEYVGMKTVELSDLVQSRIAEAIAENS